MKTLIEFVSLLDLAPSAVAEAFGNGWTPTDVLMMSHEIKHAANIKHDHEQLQAAFGALDPDSLKKE